MAVNEWGKHQEYVLSEIKRHAEEIEKMNSKVDLIYDKLDTKFDVFQERITDRFDILKDELQKNNIETNAIKNRIIAAVATITFVFSAISIAMRFVN